MPENELPNVLRSQLKAALISEANAGMIVVEVEAQHWLEYCKKVYEHPQLRFRKLKLLTTARMNNRNLLWAELESDSAAERLSMRCPLELGTPIASLSGLWPCADWQEQEIFEESGVVIEGTR